MYLLRGFLLAAVLPMAVMAADQPASPEMLWKKLEPYAQPPKEFAGKFGPYRSPLKFADGSQVKTAGRLGTTARRDPEDLAQAPGCLAAARRATDPEEAGKSRARRIY